MRTIKFRGYSKDFTENEWFDGNLIDKGNGSFQILEKDPKIWDLSYDGITVIPESIGQFTGLHDKNGKEIYEGDLVSDGNFIYEVEYNVQNTKFCISPKKRINSEFTFIDVINYNQLGNGYYSRKDLEIIGNISENPELLTD